MRYLVAVVLGAVLGIIGGRFLFVGSGLSLIPWALAPWHSARGARAYRHSA